MRIGIDLGTTTTVVAIEDRGNFPMVGFTDADGDLVDCFPSVTAEVGGELVHGFDAVVAAREGAPSIRSWKRLLGRGSIHGEIAVGGVKVPAIELATGFLQALARDLLTRSNLPGPKPSGFEAAIAVPANAHSTQRFITLEAFRRAGFDVRAVLNEPSAAGIEYAHRYVKTKKKEHVVVYDLGGGTFDAALVRIAGGRHDIERTAGIGRLGGDDFDAALLELALEKVGVDPASLDPAARAALLLECRAGKEALNPSSKRIVLELAALEGAGSVVVPVDAYYEQVRPLVAATMDAMAPLIEEENGAVYVVGGASSLPLVPRMLKERFGKNVQRSPHPSAAIAIGLAIAAAHAEEPIVSEQFTRHLGVFREEDRGHQISFDGIFAKGTQMPASEPLVAVRRYRAAHNVGHFRFVECGGLDDGVPTGDITPHADVWFPFTPTLLDVEPLTDAQVERLSGVGPMIEERYEIQRAGDIRVKITNLDAGYEREYQL